MARTSPRIRVIVGSADDAEYIQQQLGIQASAMEKTIAEIIQGKQGKIYYTQQSFKGFAEDLQPSEQVKICNYTAVRLVDHILDCLKKEVDQIIILFNGHSPKEPPLLLKAA